MPRDMEYKYILKGKRIYKTKDLMTWAKSFNKTNRVVKQEMVKKISISTVFLGLDHDFSLTSKKPILFETMLFDRSRSKEIFIGDKKKKGSGIVVNPTYTFDRCSTYKEAEEMHKKAVKLVKSKEKIDWD